MLPVGSTGESIILRHSSLFAPFSSFATMHTECSEIIAILEKVVRCARYVKAKEARANVKAMVFAIIFMLNIIPKRPV